MSQTWKECTQQSKDYFSWCGVHSFSFSLFQRGENHSSVITFIDRFQEQTKEKDRTDYSWHSSAMRPPQAAHAVNVVMFFGTKCFKYIVRDMSADRMVTFKTSVFLCIFISVKLSDLHWTKTKSDQTLHTRRKYLQAQERELIFFLVLFGPLEATCSPLDAESFSVCLCVCRGNQQDTGPPSRHAATHTHTHTLILLQIGPCSLIITHSRPCLLSGGCITPNTQPEKKRKDAHIICRLFFCLLSEKNSTLLLELSVRWHQGFLQLSPGVKQFRSPSRTLGFVDSAVRCNQVRSEILWCFDVS